MMHDILADLFSTLKNSEYNGEKKCSVRASKLVEAVLKIMHSRGFIGTYNHVEGTSPKYEVELKGIINDCNVIRPRFSVPLVEFEKWEKRFLPAAGVGVLLVTTSRGVMTHEDAKENKIGGQLIGYVY
jgi:small subunit ribosomal protein S8